MPICRTADLVGGVPHFPMSDAGVKAKDVAEFWTRQPFQLGMAGYEGNCGLCFMKKVNAIETLIRKNPESADWWAAWEKRTGDTFRRDRDSYATMQYQARHQLRMFEPPADDESVITCESGYCSD